MRLHALEHVGQKAVPERKRLFCLLVCGGFFRLPLEPLFFFLLPFSEMNLAVRVGADFHKPALIHAVRVNGRGQVGAELFFGPCIFALLVFPGHNFDIVAAAEESAIRRSRCSFPKSCTRFGIFVTRCAMCASSLRLKHAASEHESSRTSANSSVLNPVRFGQLAQLPASGTSVSSSFENGTDLRLR